jgi:hypothetical protein
MGCLYQASRNVSALVHCEPAFRKQRVRGMSPSSALTATLIAAPLPSLSDCDTAFPAVSTAFRFHLVSFLHPQPQVLRLPLPRCRHPPPCVLFRFPLLFWCHRLPLRHAFRFPPPLRHHRFLYQVCRLIFPLLLYSQRYCLCSWLSVPCAFPAPPPTSEAHLLPLLPSLRILSSFVSGLSVFCTVSAPPAVSAV